MAVELINAITDVIKHVIATNYIQYDDIKLNLLFFILFTYDNLILGSITEYRISTKKTIII